MHQVLTSVLTNLLKMVVLSRAPQDLPYRPQLAWMMALIYVVTGFFILQATARVDHALLDMLVMLMTQAGFTYVLLIIINKQPRFVQTITALLGVSVIFNLLSWPVFSVLSDNSLSEQHQHTMALVFLMFMSWEVLVKAHIYRHALDMPMVSALLVSISLFFVSIAVSQMLLPG
jgi:hypothetical protein